MIDRETIYPRSWLFCGHRASSLRSAANRAAGSARADLQPALLMEEIGERAEPRPRGLPTKWTLHVDLAIYYYRDPSPKFPGNTIPRPRPNSISSSPPSKRRWRLIPRPAYRPWKARLALLDRGRSGEVSGLFAGARRGHVPVKILAASYDGAPYLRSVAERMWEGNSVPRLAPLCSAKLGRLKRSNA